ncbi:MAG: signal peptide peptidase SppA [Methanobacteriaceae archaeon]
MNNRRKNILLGIFGTISAIFILLLLVIFVPMFVIGNSIAIIPVTGEISYDSNSEYVTTNPDSFKTLLDTANRDPAVKAIVLEINSGGGSPVASEEILNYINSSEKPVVAWISESGASGAYLLATGSDKIVAAPSSFVGSIGVIMQLEDLSDYYEKQGINRYSITGGEYKDIGANYKSLTTKERKMLQDIVDKEYAHFIELVATNRHLKVSEVEKLADGKIYTGRQAQNLKLVDYVGSKEFAIKTAAKLGGVEENYNTIILSENYGFSELISGVFSDLSYKFGEGLGKNIKSIKIANQSFSI